MKNSIIYRTGTLLLSLMLLMNFLVFADAATSIKGDVNLDGEVSAEDARIILRYSCRLCDLLDYQINRADMNKDGIVNARDARSALRRSVNLDQDDYLQEEQIKWTKTYITAFYADECNGENYNTATVENILIRGYYGAMPNYSKHVDKNDEGNVTYYGYNVLGTTNRQVFPLMSVIEYKMGNKLFYGVVLDHNNDNMAGRKYVTLDHLFCTRTEGRSFIDKYIFNDYLPIAEARIIGRMDTSGKVKFS